MHSPFPVISTDAESLRNTGGPHDINDFILQTSSLLEHVKGMMERYYNLSIILRHERAAEHMQPLLGDSAPVESESVNTSENDSISMDIERSFEEEIEMTSEQEFTLLTSQLAPLLDRAGRLLTDLAAIIGSSAQRPQEDNASVSSSLITNESGLSNTGNRLALQIPVMPSPSELAALNPRLFGPDIDIHIHAIFPQRDREEPERTPCWRQLS